MIKKLTITKLLAKILFVSSLAGCGGFSDETLIEIQMYGIERAPVGATGTKDPQFQTYDVQSITLNSPTESAILLGTPTPFKIVDRPQILVSLNAKDYIGKEYTGLTIAFAPKVIGGNNEESSLSFQLTQASLALVQTLSFSEGKSKTFVIKASWKNTIDNGVMTEPELVLSLQ